LEFKIGRGGVEGVPPTRHKLFPYRGRKPRKTGGDRKSLPFGVFGSFDKLALPAAIEKREKLYIIISLEDIGRRRSTSPFRSYRIKPQAIGHKP